MQWLESRHEIVDILLFSKELRENNFRVINIYTKKLCHALITAMGCELENER